MEKDLMTLDERELRSIVGGIDENGSGIAWGLGYSLGWVVNKVDVAIDYYRYNFP